MLGVEVDGESHDYNQIYDIQRDEKLRHIGIKIIRYRNEGVFNNIEGVYENIIKEIKIRENEIK